MCHKLARMACVYLARMAWSISAKKCRARFSTQRQSNLEFGANPRPEPAFETAATGPVAVAVGTGSASAGGASAAGASSGSSIARPRCALGRGRGGFAAPFSEGRAGNHGPTKNGSRERKRRCLAMRSNVLSQWLAQHSTHTTLL